MRARGTWTSQRIAYGNRRWGRWCWQSSRRSPTDLEGVEDATHDVEFAVQGDEVYVVQARPVVGTGFPEGGDETTVWSRANVGEALPGVATPLTWSVARGFSERGFRQAFGSLGCTVPPDAAMVTNVHGRFYLNLTAFMRIAAQVPGLDPETLVGVGGGMRVPQLDEQIQGVSRRAFFLRLPATAARLLAEQARLSTRVDRFARRARRRHRKRRGSQLGRLDDRQLVKAMGEVLRDLDQTGTLMLACASASLASHLGLKTLLRWLSVDQPESTAQTLTAGCARPREREAWDRHREDGGAGEAAAGGIQGRGERRVQAGG